MSELSESRAIYNSDFAAVIPRCTGFTSAISSSIIIWVILRSTRRLSTIYHRLMFGMALSDLMSSVAIGLTTLPMPEGVIINSYGVEVIIAGTRLGNFHSCEAQGFFYTFGLVTGLMYYAMLSVYYACAIALNMRESKIRKFVEPFLHLLPISLGLTASLPPLFYHLYNISMFEAWCAFTPHPIAGKYADRDVNRLPLGIEIETIYSTTIAVALIVTFTIIVLSLLAVICRVRQNEQKIKLCRNDDLQQEGQEEEHQNSLRARHREEVLHAHQTTKVILIQSTAYIFVYATVVFWFIATLIIKKPIFIYLFLTFFPLQGFYNMVIFLGHKVYSFKTANPSLSYCKILLEIVEKSPPDPVHVYRLSIVEETMDARGNLEAICIAIHDEFGEEDELESDLSASTSDENNEEQIENSEINISSSDRPSAMNIRIVEVTRRLEAKSSSDIVGADMVSTLTPSSLNIQRIMSEGFDDDPSSTGQLSMKVHRNGNAFGPSHNSSEASSPSDGSNHITLTGVATHRNSLESSLTKSFDESGSHKIGGDGDMSSLRDLSGFGLSNIDSLSFRS